MISAKVDLTENRDFGEVRRDIEHVFDDVTFMSNEEFNRIRTLKDIMSTDDYNLLKKYEGFFGQRLHLSDAYNIFKQKDEEFLNNMNTVCARCGKFLLPWKRRGDMSLCKECDDALDDRIPWISKHKLVSFTNASDDRDVLQLR